MGLGLESIVERPEWAKDGRPFIRLSHSSLSTLMTCDRKFEMEKLLTFGEDREDSVNFSFGHAFGDFVATYLLTQSFEMAIFDAWVSYFPVLEDENKSEETCFELCYRAVPKLDAILQEWEVAYFKGEPAIELSFKIDIDDIFYYVGYMDVVLKNRKTGVYAVVDAKTTKLHIQDLSPVYKFSGQVIGYSIALDQIAQEEESTAEFETIYFVGRLGRDPWGDHTTAEVYNFPKKLSDRLDWFVGVLQMANRIRLNLELGTFPKTPTGCLLYNKPCRFYGVCQLRSQDSMREIPEDTQEYMFTYNAEEVIANLTARI